MDDARRAALLSHLSRTAVVERRDEDDGRERARCGVPRRADARHGGDRRDRFNAPFRASATIATIATSGCCASNESYGGRELLPTRRQADYLRGKFRRAIDARLPMTTVHEPTAGRRHSTAGVGRGRLLRLHSRSDCQRHGASDQSAIRLSKHLLRSPQHGSRTRNMTGRISARTI